MQSNAWAGEHNQYSAFKKIRKEQTGKNLDVSDLQVRQVGALGWCPRFWIVIPSWMTVRSKQFFPVRAVFPPRVLSCLECTKVGDFLVQSWLERTKSNNSSRQDCPYWFFQVCTLPWGMSILGGDNLLFWQIRIMLIDFCPAVCDDAMLLTLPF